MKFPEFDWDSEFDAFLDSLNDIEAAKLLTVIQNIERLGLHVAQRQKWIKKLENNLYEIRANTSEAALRGIYFQIKDNKYFVTHGFKKKSNKTPKKEIEKGLLIRKKILKKRGSKDE